MYFNDENFSKSADFFFGGWTEHNEILSKKVYPVNLYRNQFDRPLFFNNHSIRFIMHYLHVQRTYCIILVLPILYLNYLLRYR